MTINWEEGYATIRKNRVDLDVARQWVRKEFPHVVQNHIIRSFADKDGIRIIVDWRNVFSLSEVQMYLTQKIIDAR